VSFTGELGYELYMSPEYQRHVHDALIRAGGTLGLRHFGVRALTSLRIEKGYGAWGREYTQDYTAVEAGLQHSVHTQKPTFIGREAALTQLAAGPSRKLRILAIESRGADPIGGEPIMQAGRPIARLTSAAFGHTLGHSVGLAYLPVEMDAQAEGLEVEFLGSRWGARVLPAPPYDPAGNRLRG
jgi:dimethylglycine dehydrogenase